MSRLAASIAQYIQSNPQITLIERRDLSVEDVPTKTQFLVCPHDTTVSDIAKLNRLFDLLTFPSGYTKSMRCRLDYHYAHWPYIAYQEKVGVCTTDTTMSYSDMTAAPTRVQAGVQTFRLVEPIIYSVQVLLYTNKALVAHALKRPQMLGCIERAVLRERFGDTTH